MPESPRDLNTKERTGEEKDALGIGAEAAQPIIEEVPAHLGGAEVRADRLALEEHAAAEMSRDDKNVTRIGPSDVTGQFFPEFPPAP